MRLFSKRNSAGLVRRARKIRLLLMDVDGVLTDGRIWLQSWPDGSAHEIKGFSAYDGAGLKIARSAGLRTGIITGRESPATTRRGKEAGIEFVYQNRPEKLTAYKEILRRARVTDAQVAYVGDDLPDLSVMSKVGLAIAVANAAPEVKSVAHYVTRRHGGDGAVREVVEFVLKAQGKWAAAVKKARA